MKVLPVGEQDFEKLRSKEMLYVDKTRYIYDLLGQGTYFFLSRPRRFGKTLLVDTMKCLFEGRRELFKGLWLEERYDWDKTYPVIKVSFNEAIFGEIPLAEALNQAMAEAAQHHGLTLQSQTPGAKLSELIKALAAKHATRVVLLIDEYDKPITDNLDALPRARGNRDVLKKFYSPLKSLDKHLHFVFVTGVSKYGKVSIFSDLNNLNDLTTAKPMAALTGYTQEELEANMAEHMAATAQEMEMDFEAFATKLKRFYNGYTWDGRTAVYNPFSINKFFYDRDWKGYWFSTGTPTMLVKLLAQQQRLPQDFENEWGTESLMDKLSLDAPPNELVALLWQTGYLTIKEVKKTTRQLRYRLGFPNWEVKDALLVHVWHHYARQAGSNMPDNRLVLLADALEAGDLDTFFEHFQSLMATIPYQLFTKNEAYYHTLIYLVAELSGLQPMAEVASAGGRADMVLQTEAATYVFEFKTAGDPAAGAPVEASIEEGLAQIKEKGYHHPYLNQGRQVVLVGVVFDAASRTLAGWQQESL